MRFFLILVAIAGCQRQTSSCEPAISGAMDRMVAEMRGKMGATVTVNVERMLPQMKHSIIEACKADHWKKEAIDCVAAANGKAALDLCDQMLTPQQRQNEHRRDDELLRAAVQPLQKPDADRTRKDPHAGLGIPPVDELRPAGTPSANGSGSN